MIEHIVFGISIGIVISALAALIYLEIKDMREAKRIEDRNNIDTVICANLAPLNEMSRNISRLTKEQNELKHRLAKLEDKRKKDK